MIPEIYVSTDVETDGPIPGPNSMLSIGSVAFTEDGKEVGAFTRNLLTLSGASMDEETSAWWATQPEAWEACRTNCQHPREAIAEYVDWLKALPGKPVFVGYPAGFDFTFVYWYIRYFGHQSPFSFSAIDIKTYAMAILGTTFKDTTKKNMPKVWFPPDSPHTHVAVEDAREQGKLFINILKAGKKLRQMALNWRNSNYFEA